MDFESYIGRERQLLARIERERAELNSHEPRAEAGNYQLAEDEIRLLKSGDYVTNASELAADVVKALDERMVLLKHLEESASTRNETFVKRVGEWETRFDVRYVELMEKINKEMAALDARNAELSRKIEVAERNMKDIGASAEESLSTARQQAEADIRSISESTEASLKDISKATTGDVDRLVDSLRRAQAEFETSVNEKLENDKQTIERIKYMITAMNEIIKT